MAFEPAYRSGTPPWDIDRAQPAFAALAAAGAIQGRVLDAGCGTGENAPHLAARGLDVTGIDAAPTAIRRASEKAAQRGLAARFLVADALALRGIGEPFDAVIDSGLFHVFDDHDRARYVESLRGVVRPGGRAFILCFSDREPPGWGPRRVREADLRAAFSQGWRVDAIVPQAFASTLSPAQAWLASLTRA